MVHQLKTDHKYFVKLADGTKTFEVRWADRDFRVGDLLALNETEDGKETGRFMLQRVTYILDEPDYCKQGFVVMGLEKMALYGRGFESEHDYRDAMMVVGVPVYAAEGRKQKEPPEQP